MMRKFLIFTLAMLLSELAHAQVLLPQRPVSHGAMSVAAARGEDWKYRAAASQEARIFSAMLICIADAAHHTIVQRDCISFKRTHMIVVI
jgi:hypothetical protein